jgi:hypothetical protein
MSNRLNNIWLSHHSIEKWDDVGLWSNYLSEVEVILNEKIVHLDDKDPVRRKAGSLVDSAEFICDLKPKEEYRWVYGKLGKSGITFSVKYFRKVQGVANNIQWHFPDGYLDGNDSKAEGLKGLFRWGNQYFSPFWSFGDRLENIMVGAKEAGRGAVNIQRELLSVFWLNYFCPAYVSFFGRDKFNSFPEVIVEKDGGLTAMLGLNPSVVSKELRAKFVEILGKDSFVNPQVFLPKPEGKYALSFEQLRAYGAVTA